MPRYERFTFLCNERERWLIKKLAKKLQRSQSDAIRFLIVNATQELEEQARSSKTKMETH